MLSLHHFLILEDSFSLEKWQHDLGVELDPLSNEPGEFEAGVVNKVLELLVNFADHFGFILAATCARLVGSLFSRLDSICLKETVVSSRFHGDFFVSFNV